MPSIAGPESRRKWVSVPCSGTLEVDISAPALGHFLLQAEESIYLALIYIFSWEYLQGWESGSKRHVLIARTILAARLGAKKSDNAPGEA